MKRVRELESWSEGRKKDKAGGRGRRRSVDVGNVRRISLCMRNLTSDGRHDREWSWQPDGARGDDSPKEAAYEKR